jgi:hypothetical protein
VRWDTPTLQHLRRRIKRLGGLKRQMVTIDEYGNTVEQKPKSRRVHLTHADYAGVFVAAYPPGLWRRTGLKA